MLDVDVHWSGNELHRKVGVHGVTANVMRMLPDGTEAMSCFEVPFVIEDTDECTLPNGHAMRHNCDASAKCVNNAGSYECECTGGASFSWNLSLKSSTCSMVESTADCCAPGDDACRSNFFCPVDPCLASQNDCDGRAGATCEATILGDGTPPTYQCECPDKKIGSGHTCGTSDARPAPKVGFDGQPTTDTIEANYCSCTNPTIDPCTGFPKCPGKNQACVVNKKNEPTCGCKAGYVDTESHGCVDETPPTLSLRCDADKTGVMKLKQGDNYEECAVDIIDDNAEDLARSLKITYSKPLPAGCLRTMGQWHVNYTVATPWTEPPFQRVTRTVQIDDLDECRITPSQSSLYCKEALPHCDLSAGAVCKNTIGSYSCQCPTCTSGDGFLSISGVTPGGPFSPSGYEGGSGCRDSCKPKIELLGPNPRVFRACKCAGLVGLTGDAKKLSSGSDFSPGNYDAEIKALVKAQGGAELCATKDNADSVTSAQCASAQDQTPSGVTDLTSKIVVADPVKHPSKRNTWRVAYNVVDAAGNRADTVWRDVVVEELSYLELEEVLRKESETEKRKDIKKAVDAALKKERASCGKKVTDATNANKDKKNYRCPACVECVQEECNCEGDVGEVLRDLQECRGGAQAAGAGGRGLGLDVVATLDQIFPLLLLLIIGSSGLGLALLVLQRAKGLVSGGGGEGAIDREGRAAELAKSINTYHSPRHGTPMSNVGTPATPATPQSGQSGGRPYGASPLFSSGGGVGGAGAGSGGGGSPYNTLSPITPMRSGPQTRSKR